MSVADAFTEVCSNCITKEYDKVIEHLISKDPDAGKINLLGLSFKGNNRNEQREIVIGTMMTRVMHDIFNKLSKILAKEFDEEAMSSKGKSITKL